MAKNITFQNELPPQKRIDVTNRSAANMLANDVVVLDILQADAASTTAGKGFGNVLAPATANLLSKACVYDGATAIADDGEAAVVLAGPVKAKVNGAVAKGDRLEISNGADHFSTIPLTGGIRMARVQAIALEANTSGDAVKLVQLLEHPAYAYVAA